MQVLAEFTRRRQAALLDPETGLTETVDSEFTEDEVALRARARLLLAPAVNHTTEPPPLPPDPTRDTATWGYQAPSTTPSRSTSTTHEQSPNRQRTTSQRRSDPAGQLLSSASAFRTRFSETG